MKRYGALFAALLVVLLSTCSIQALDLQKYAWEFPVVTGISQDSSDMIDELRGEVEIILKSGHLAPLRVSHADQLSESYFLYLEPGRIITTLAWAYPYLTPEQQAAVKKYVKAEFEDPIFAPWASKRIPADVNATRREYFQLSKVWNWNTSWQPARPTVQTLYGVWLWAFRSGDWDGVRPYWNEIKNAYSRKSGQANIYGTMSAHIAIARLADRFGDTKQRDEALKNLDKVLNDGLKLSMVEKYTKNLLYKEMYDNRQTGSIYRGFMFLDLSPEIGRYLKENVKDQVLELHQSGKEMFPLWYIVDAPYFQRNYTGDEGIGLITPEMMGMIFPIERWVVEADSKTLAGYMMSAPSCIGDCFWIDCLVQAIESTGSLSWIDVRG